MRKMPQEVINREEEHVETKQEQKMNRKDQKQKKKAGVEQGWR
jgi:hypothetical protein